jgi:mRNA interferase MazF
VVVPFPFTNLAQPKKRPVIALSPRAFQASHRHGVFGMITDARNPRWPSDVQLTDLTVAGLSFPSVFRNKLFTLDLSLVLRKIGTLSSRDRAAVTRTLRAAIVS